MFHFFNFFYFAPSPNVIFQIWRHGRRWSWWHRWMRCKQLFLLKDYFDHLCRSSCFSFWFLLSWLIAEAVYDVDFWGHIFQNIFCYIIWSCRWWFYTLVSSWWVGCFLAGWFLLGRLIPTDTGWLERVGGSRQRLAHSLPDILTSDRNQISQFCWNFSVNCITPPPSKAVGWGWNRLGKLVDLAQERWTETERGEAGRSFMADMECGQYYLRWMLDNPMKYDPFLVFTRWHAIWDTVAHGGLVCGVWCLVGRDQFL